MIEFVEKGISYVVKRSGDKIVYRDKAHLGGRWTDAVKAMRNTSLRHSFRKCLRECVETLAHRPIS